MMKSIIKKVMYEVPKICTHDSNVETITGRINLFGTFNYVNIFFGACTSAKQINSICVQSPF